MKYAFRWRERAVRQLQAIPQPAALTILQAPDETEALVLEMAMRAALDQMPDMEQFKEAESAVETARPLIDASGHTLTLALPPEPVYVDADLTRLAQVFGNLLTNSAKYTPKGGKIWLTVERRGGEVAVSVRDNGIGIPAASLADIFDMFSQVDRSMERNTGGLGIGLALVKGLVEMHGGTVTAESAGADKGSTFTVRLRKAEPG